MRRAAVIDASAFVNLLIDPSWAGGPERVLGDARHYVPGHFDVEVSSALNGLVRGGRVASNRAQDLVAMTHEFPATRVSPMTLLHRAWKLRTNFSLYDAFYLALARELECDLVTADRSLAGAGEAGVPIRLLG